MSVFWVGDRSGAPLAALVPRQVKQKLDGRQVKSRPAPSPAPAGPPGGTSALETLPADLRVQLFAFDGWNLVRELLALARVSRTLKDAVGDGPREAVARVLPALRGWRNSVFPHKAPPRARVNSFSRSPAKRKARNRPIMSF
mmetsp:Transcript_27985/g.83871  ORF Transcript_27985/g.83871 Transcript_27985/m.83871 type:complete len:142 (-) Transcript_27985:10-435(-)